jgi:hypothetical protein
VQALESQVSELESEVNRLSRALEAQKTMTSELETSGNKKAEEFVRELHKKVRNLTFLLLGKLISSRFALEHRLSKLISSKINLSNTTTTMKSNGSWKS